MYIFITELNYISIYLLKNNRGSRLRLVYYTEVENKICFKMRFPLTKRSENEWLFEKIKYMLISLSKLFFKIEKRKAELGDCFSFF